MAKYIELPPDGSIVSWHENPDSDNVRTTEIRPTTVFQIVVDGHLAAEVTVTELRNEINPVLWDLVWSKLKEHTAKAIGHGEDHSL